jgi:ectoine hydroxylase-related dioxygenase (phytanoyl-CoA dioxygenase family)
VHLKSEALGRIATEPEVLRVVRTYFGCEPLMIECMLNVSNVNQFDILSTGFHFDHAGVRSLNVMVYLNDVDLETGPHVLVAGTQRGKKLRDYFREMTSIAEIERRYPEQIRTITGPAGTVLIENAEVFHRRLVPQKRRYTLIVVFSTNRRRLLSIGRNRRP